MSGDLTATPRPPDLEVAVGDVRVDIWFRSVDEIHDGITIEEGVAYLRRLAEATTRHYVYSYSCRCGLTGTGEVDDARLKTMMHALEAHRCEI